MWKSETMKEKQGKGNIDRNEKSCYVRGWQ